MEMTPRERVLRALSLQEPDRVPVDIGCIASGIHGLAYRRLLEHLGRPDLARRAKMDPQSNMAQLDEEVLTLLGADTRKVGRVEPEDVPVEVMERLSYRDEWGVLWIRAEGGHFMNKMGPFQEREPTLRDLERHRWPDLDDPRRYQGLREEAARLRAETDYALVVGVPYAIVRECQRVRGFAEWLEDLILNPTLAQALMEKVLEVAAGIATRILEEVGEHVDVVFFPDDLGFQDRSYFRPELYRRMVKPYHRRLVEAIRSKTQAKVVMHSDGAIYELIPDLIDVGVDGINPVQVSARGMDTRRLKTEFGRHLAFWGGIDTQRILPFGSPQEVREEVRRRIEDLAPGGGYVLASVHNIQAEVPPENIVAMFQAARELGSYARLGV